MRNKKPKSEHTSEWRRHDVGRTQADMDEAGGRRKKTDERGTRWKKTDKDGTTWNDSGVTRNKLTTTRGRTKTKYQHNY